MTSYIKNPATPSSSTSRPVTAATSATSAGIAAVPLRLGGIVLGLAQFAFAFLAAWDLAQRDADEVRGPKLAWVPALFLNWIGPAAYFLFGIRHEDR